MVGKKLLTFADFKTLVDDAPGVKTVELSNWGEIFLNPDLLAIMAYAHQKKLVLTAINGTNFNHVKDEVLEGLVKYQFSHVSCSIDGASQATYGQYRRRGSFDRVVAHIRRLNTYKQRYGSVFPALTWQFVLFEHNKHELAAARDMARDLGMAFYAKISWDKQLAARIDEDDAPDLKQVLLGLQEGENSFIKTICHQLWNEPQINSNGKILGCCANFWGDFGDAFAVSGLQQALNNEKLVYARKMLAGMASPKKGIPCTDCYHYRRIKRELDWVSSRELGL